MWRTPPMSVYVGIYMCRTKTTLRSLPYSMTTGTTLRRSASNITPSQLLFRNAFVQDLFLKMAQNAAYIITSRDYAKRLKSALLESAHPSCCFHGGLLSISICFVVPTRFSSFSKRYKMLWPLLRDSPAILRYLTLLLPPTFVDFASACLLMIAEQ